MATFGLVEYADAGPEVRAVYDDIMATRKTDWINNFWKALANDPALLKRTWEDIKQIMAPGALDPLIKEMIYVAVIPGPQTPPRLSDHTSTSSCLSYRRMPSKKKRRRTRCCRQGSTRENRLAEGEGFG